MVALQKSFGALQYELDSLTAFTRHDNFNAGGYGYDFRKPGRNLKKLRLKKILLVAVGC